MTMRKLKDEREALHLLRPVPPPNPLRQEAARRAYLQQAAHWRAERLARGRFAGRSRPIPLRSLATALLLVTLLLAGVRGTAYAADRARPGDPLYPLDRSLETLQLHLTRDPQRRAALQLSYAEERLDEAESLFASGDETDLTTALEAYTEIILTLPPSPALDQTLTRHEMRLHQLWERAADPARHGLERALEAVEKERSSPPTPSAPASHPTPSAPSDAPHGPPEDRPGQAATKTPHRPEDAGPPKDRGKDRPKDKK